MLVRGSAPVFASAALAATLLAGCGGGGKSPEVASTPKAALTVTTVRPQRLELLQRVMASGSIEAWQEAIIGAEPQGWRLAEVRVDVGARVRKGQVLAVFNGDMVQAEQAQAKAAVAEAEAMLVEAGSNAQRARDLRSTGAWSTQQINQYLTAEHTAQARLEAARAALRVQQLRSAQTQVLAPDDGIVSARSATLGAVVPAGAELFRLLRQGRLEWRAEVDAADLARLRPGQAVRVTPAGGETLAGVVRMLAPKVDAGTRNGVVFVDLPQPGSARAGMFARGEFETGSSTALTLPQGAVLLRDGFSYVFTLDAQGKVTQLKIGVGRRVGERIEITSGLDPAARVVASGVGFLADGDTVRVVAGAPAVAAPATK